MTRHRLNAPTSVDAPLKYGTNGERNFTSSGWRNRKRLKNAEATVNKANKAADRTSMAPVIVGVHPRTRCAASSASGLALPRHDVVTSWAPATCRPAIRPMAARSPGPCYAALPAQDGPSNRYSWCAPFASRSCGLVSMSSCDPVRPETGWSRDDPATAGQGITGVISQSAACRFPSLPAR